MRLFESIKSNRCFTALRCGACAALLFLITAAAPGALAGQFREYEVKAVFVYNLTNFITWPQGTFDPQSNQFKIAIVGKDPFGQLLDQLVADERVQGNFPIVIERVKNIGELENCHLLFVSSDAKSQWQRIFAKVKERSILTVADSATFAHNGGMVNLMRRDNRIEIEINADLARRCGLSVSAKLLELSTIIRP